VQELTHSDITLFVHEKIELDQRFQELRENDDRCPDFVTDIVDAAAGVFLWVHLVILSLLDGLTNNDRIMDLERRLENIPRDLDTLFEHILESISPFYREQSARFS
jgi:hypothetical protein